MPAPIGSYVSFICNQKDNFWFQIGPASCLALIEILNDECKYRIIVPLGFEEMIDDMSHVSMELHVSKSDAEIRVQATIDRNNEPLTRNTKQNATTEN